MDQATHNKIVSFLWSIADDVLRDLFKRGKYPDVILPMCVLRRLDFAETPESKIFPNKAFGYWKVVVERPLRPHNQLSRERITSLRFASGDEAIPRPDPLHGLYEIPIAGKKSVVEYESDSDLRDSEQIPLLEEGGIEAFIRREVLPYTPDARVKKDATKIGYGISFTRHFYQPPQLRTLAEISADILALEQETEGLLSEITKGVTA